MPDMRLTRHLGATLRRQRELRQLSQRQLAKLAGTTQGAVARIETGTRDASVPMLERLFAALDVQLRVEVEPLDAHIDAAIAELAATPVAERVAALRLADIAASLDAVAFVFDGITAAVLQGAPLPGESVQLALLWEQAEAFTDWLGHHYGRRWHAQWHQFGYLPLDPHHPAPHRWSTIFGEVHARMGDELPAAIDVRHGDRVFPVVPLADIQVDDRHAADLLDRYRRHRAGAAG